MNQDARHAELQAKVAARRWFFEQCGVGLGGIALCELFKQTAMAGEADGRAASLNPTGRLIRCSRAHLTSHQKPSE